MPVAAAAPPTNCRLVMPNFFFLTVVSFAITSDLPAHAART